jgi:virulence surface antigen
MADMQKKELIWDDMQEKARKDGDLLYAFDQERPVETHGIPKPENGYCVGLTLRWIALRYAGKDYEYDAEKKEGVKADYEALASQYRSKSTPGGPFRRAEAVLRDFYISTNPGLYAQFSHPASADMLIKAITHDGLYYIEMRGMKPNGEEHAHALAIQRERHGAVYRLFDSNEGHFVLKGAAHFKKFLAWFLHAVPFQGKHMTPYSKTYLKETWIVGVNPPPK